MKYLDQINKNKINAAVASIKQIRGGSFTEGIETC